MVNDPHIPAKGGPSETRLDRWARVFQATVDFMVLLDLEELEAVHEYAENLVDEQNVAAAERAAERSQEQNRGD
jgi:hypothetical protein